MSEPVLDVSAAYNLTALNLDDMLAGNPALQSALRDTNSLRHQIEASKKAHLPELALNVTGKYQEQVLGNNPGQNEARAMITATWNAYDGGLAKTRTKQLRARERENQQRLLKARNELKQDAYNIMSVLRTSRSKTDIFISQVDASARVVELYFKQFEAGRRTLLELLDAQADLSTAQEERIANKYENLSASFASLRFQNMLSTSLVEQMKIEPAILK